MSSRLSKRNVYYSTLENDQKVMYSQIRADLTRYIGKSDTDIQARNLQMAADLKNSAHAEALKEIALINDYFSRQGIIAPFQIQEADVYDKNFGRKLIQLINTVYQAQSLFERAVSRISSYDTQNNRRISYSKFFEDRFIEILKDKTKSLPPTDWLTKSVREILESVAYEAIYDTLEQMGHSKDFTYGGNAGYEYLVPELKAIKNKTRGNQLVEGLYNAMQLPQLMANIGEEKVSSPNDLKYKIGTLQSIFRQEKGKGGGNKYVKVEANLKGGQRAGIIQEILAVFIGEVQQSKVGGKTTWTGYRDNMKADFIASLGVDVDAVMRVIEGVDTNSKSVRRRNIERLQEVNKYLKTLKGGFLTYVSAKEYTMTNSFQGFKVENQTLENFYETWRGTNVAELVGAAQQLTHGSTIIDGEKAQMREELERRLASQMARFLFDDYRAIGNEQKGAKSIHLMLLNGVYIPLSYLMFLLSKAMEKTAKDDYKQIVDAHIKVGHGAKTIFMDGKKFVPPDYYSTDPGRAWDEQREISLKNITIQTKILSNFRDLIRKLNLI